MPKLIAETRGRDQLVQLFAAGLVQAAIVPRFVFPAPIEKPRTPRDWFEVYWQVINPSNVPKDEAPAEDSEASSEKPSPHPKTRPSKTNSEPAKIDSPESGSTQKPSSTPQ